MTGYVIVFVLLVALTVVLSILCYKRLSACDWNIMGYFLFMGAMLTFIGAVCTLASAFDYIHDNSADTIYYENLKTRCESMDGAFNESHSYPACYVNGEKVE